MTAKTKKPVVKKKPLKTPEALLLKSNLKTFSGAANLYRLSRPLKDYDGKGHRFVIVSAKDVMFSGPETYIFPATEDGEIVDWMEMPGSFRGSLDHNQALRNAGYEVVDG